MRHKLGAAFAERQAGPRQGLTLAAVAFLPMLIVVALQPALPGMIAAFASTPAADAILPWVVGLPGLAVAFLSGPIGWLLDRYQRRAPLLVAIGLYILSGIMPLLSGSLAALVLSRVAIGISQAVLVVGSSAILADYFSASSRRTWLTVQAIGAALLAPLAVIASGMLAEHGWQQSFLLYLVAVPVLLCTASFCYEPVRSQEEVAEQATPTAFPWARAAALCVVTFLIGVLFFGFVIHAAMAFGAIGVTDTARLGRLIGLVSLGLPVGPLIFNLISRRLNSTATIAVTVTTLSAALAGVGLSQSLGAMLAFATIHQIACGMALPGMIFWVSQNFPPAIRGRGFGLWSTALYLGQFMAAPLLAGGRIISGDLLGGFVVIACLGALGAAPFLWWPFRRSRRNGSSLGALER